ncbi:bifunctional diguanylate cyclase/phosphodiesterase [Pantoea sp. 1.19]|uniref:putative bifunctional diguanylate cyclase/phosphodiesterase n=1 Tax=Pantoea sp. 1.19 TaxID=1925589 RepID=UPI000948B5AD|nr:EAL domain-containing protein [Pantoea sp. 1.19]
MPRYRPPEERDAIFAQILDHSTNSIFLADSDGSLLFANASGKRLWSRLSERRLLLSTLQQDDQVLELQDGLSPRFVKTHSVITQKPPASPEYLFIGTDVSAELLAQEEERRLRRRLEQTLEIAEEGFWLWDIGEGWVSHNHCWSRLFGFDETRLRHRDSELFTLIHPDDRQRYSDALASHLRGATPVFNCEYRIILAHQQTVWLRNIGKAVRHDERGMALEMLGKVTDITESKAREQEMHQLAWHDHLTQLDNRSRFFSKVDAARERARLSGNWHALLYLDLNRFKDVNDSLGHSAGDRLLVEVASRLRQTLRSGDIISRLGGDEFAVLIQSLGEDRTHAYDRLSVLAERLIDAISQECTLDGHVVTISTSIGIYLFQADDQPVSEMLHKADMAQYYSKRKQQRWMLWSPRLGEAQSQRDSIERGLRRALDNNELFLLYQPQYRRDGRIDGVEALLRWENAAGELIPPSRFIPVAEHSGLIITLSDWVLDQVCQQLRAWQQQPALAALRASVNVSPRQLKQPDFVLRVEQSLLRHGVLPGRLSIEMAETTLNGELADVQRKLQALQAMQVGVSMDNFGTGDASLTGLRNLAIGEVKIDRSFVLDMSHNAGNEQTIRAIVAMCQALEIDVVAEGVEQAAHYRSLAAMGCQRFQGWLFSRALPAQEIASLMHAAGPQASA